jgi:hypothetical protein
MQFVVALWWYYPCHVFPIALNDPCKIHVCSLCVNVQKLNVHRRPTRTVWPSNSSSFSSSTSTDSCSISRSSKAGACVSVAVCVSSITKSTNSPDYQPCKQRCLQPDENSSCAGNCLQTNFSGVNGHFACSKKAPGHTVNRWRVRLGILSCWDFVRRWLGSVYLSDNFSKAATSTQIYDANSTILQFSVLAELCTRVKLLTSSYPWTHPKASSSSLAKSIAIRSLYNDTIYSQNWQQAYIFFVLLSVRNRKPQSKRLI